MQYVCVGIKKKDKQKQRNLEQGWVYFLRNLIIESVKCNGVSMHPKLAAFPKNNIK